METAELYDLVYEAVREVVEKEMGGGDALIAKRMSEGKVTFEDNEGRSVKEIDSRVFFKKVTSVREKLRVLEQKINNHPKLDERDAAELQVHLTRCYGSLTTFNFLFREDRERFRGSGS